MKNESLEVLTKPFPQMSAREKLIWWVAEMIFFNRQGELIQMSLIAPTVYAYLVVFARWGMLDKQQLSQQAISRIANSIQEIIIYRLEK